MPDYSVNRLAFAGKIDGEVCFAIDKASSIAEGYAESAVISGRA
jgi:hypothetical protein